MLKSQIDLLKNSYEKGIRIAAIRMHTTYASMYRRLMQATFKCMSENRSEVISLPKDEFCKKYNIIPKYYDKFLADVATIKQVAENTKAAYKYAEEYFSGKKLEDIARKYKVSKQAVSARLDYQGYVKCYVPKSLAEEFFHASNS